MLNKFSGVLFSWKWYSRRVSLTVQSPSLMFPSRDPGQKSGEENEISYRRRPRKP